MVNSDPHGAIVFTDIVGFTELTAIHGDDAAVKLLSLQDEVVEATLPPSARVVKEIGDGMLLWFDDMAAAIRTGLDLQQGYRAASVDGLPLWVRMGMHWGCPRRRGNDIVGHDVNLASRIAGLAGPGEILCTGDAVTAATADGELEGVAFDQLGPVFVKGIPDPVPVSRVTRAS